MHPRPDPPDRTAPPALATHRVPARLSPRSRRARPTLTYIWNPPREQFFITTGPAPWCDKRNVVFGEVRSGMDVVRHIQSYASDHILYRPSVDVLISRCGTL